MTYPHAHRRPFGAGLRTALLLSLPCLGLGLMAETRPSTTGLPTGAVLGFWQFQDGIKGRALRQQSRVADTGGRDRHGYTILSASHRRAHNPGSNQALFFHPEAEGCVRIPDDEIFVVDKGLSLEAYIHPAVAGLGEDQLAMLISRGDTRPGKDPWFLALDAHLHLVFQLEDSQGTVSRIRSPKPVSAGRSQHVAGTWDASTGLMMLYIDGKPVAQERSKVRPLRELKEGGVSIGGMSGELSHWYTGAIDEVRICGIALERQQLLPPPQQR